MSSNFQHDRKTEPRCVNTWRQSKGKPERPQKSCVAPTYHLKGRTGGTGGASWRRADRMV